MGAEPEKSHKCTQCKGSHKTWSFQTIFNTVFIVLFSLSSVGLWVCLMEINRLKQTTNSLLETVSEFKDTTSNDMFHDLKRNEKQRRANDQMKNKESVYGTFKIDSKMMSKRAAIPVRPAAQTVSRKKHGVTFFFLLITTFITFHKNDNITSMIATFVDLNPNKAI